MADNVPIKDSSSGYSADFAQLLVSFAENNGELRTILTELNNTIKNLSKSESKEDKTRAKELSARLKNIESLDKYTNSFDDAEKTIKQLSRELSVESGKLGSSSISSVLEELSTTIKDSNAKVSGLYKDILKSGREITSLESQLRKNSVEIEKATKAGKTEIVNDLKKQQAQYQTELQTKLKLNDAQKKELELQTAYNDEIGKIRSREAKAIQESMQARTTLASKADEFKPEAVKQFENSISNIKNYFNPKGSKQYKDTIAQFDERQEQLSNRKNIINDTITQLTLDIPVLNEKADSLELQAENAENDSERENLLQQASVIRKSIEANERQLESLDRESELIDEEYAFLDEERASLENNTKTSTNLISSALKFIQKWVTKAVDRELDNISSAADKVFTSFEDMQKSLGKQLKLSAGAYDDMKDKLMAAADAAGKAIDVTQLNEAAVSMSEMGITNTSLITEMSLGLAKWSEAGISAQLDEETVRVMNSTFAELKRNNPSMSDDEAAKIATAQMDDMIAIEEAVRQEYGSVTALENGGWQEIMNQMNKLVETGDLEYGGEEYRQTMANLASSWQAMSNNYMDPSIIMQDIDSLKNGTMTELPTYLKVWFGNNDLGINDKDSFYEAIGSDQFGDVLMSLTQNVASIVSDNATDSDYLRNTYGLNIDADQARTIKNRYENAEQDYSNTNFSEENLKAVGDAVQKGIENGDYLTATEGLEKQNISLVQELASKYQNIPDGAFWMGEGFNEIRSIVDDALGLLFGFLTTLITGNSLFGGGSGGGLGNLSDIFGEGTGTAIKDFATGNMETTAGKVGTYGTMAVGGVMSAASAVSNFKDAENFEDGLVSTFRDPQFTSGLGTVIGGAIGGPIGGAIGGALGSFVPTVSEGLENWLCRNISEPWEEAEQKNAEQLAKAADSLQRAADTHSRNIDAMQNDMDNQLAMFSDFSDNQKEIFVEQMELTDEEKAQLAEQKGISVQELTNQDLFDGAINKWMGQQEEAMEQERALERGTSLVSDSLANAIGVDNGANWSESEVKNLSSDAKKSTAKMLGLNWEDVKNLSNSELAKKFTQAEENAANTRVMLENDSGTQLLTDIENYANSNGIDDFATAASQYLQKIDPNLYTGDQLETATKVLTEAEQYKSKYDSANNTFHENLQEIIEANPTIEDYNQLFEAYKEKYTNFDYDAVEGLEEKDKIIYVNGQPNFSGTLPDLRYTNSDEIGSTQGNMYNRKHMNYAPELYEGKYKTGLDFVPFDDFIALLHQGEMVLNKSEADTYRQSGTSDNGLAAADITNSVNAQTDKLIDILTKILQVLTIRTGSGSKLPKSLVQMNSDISLLG